MPSKICASALQRILVFVVVQLRDVLCFSACAQFTPSENKNLSVSDKKWNQGIKYQSQDDENQCDWLGTYAWARSERILIFDQPVQWRVFKGNFVLEVNVIKSKEISCNKTFQFSQIQLEPRDIPILSEAPETEPRLTQSHQLTDSRVIRSPVADMCDDSLRSET